jgi:hypothetical protein
MENNAADDGHPGTLNIGQNATGIIGQNISNAVFIAQQQVITPEAIRLQPFQARSPYKSLKRFDVDDSEYFFGRYQFVGQLLESIKISNLILVAGPSGSGKSSVVRAKLVPDFLGASSERHDFILTPKENPFRSLYESLIGRDKTGPDKDYCFNEENAQFVLEGTPDVLARVVRELKHKESEWLIFIDQFEELFTRCTNPEQCKNFIDSLTQVAEAKDRSLKIVLAMRADFMGELSRYRDFWSSVKSQFLLVTDMTEDDLQMAIKGPAAKHGVQFEPGLTKKIIEDVLGQPGALPLMQYTLDQLWRYEEKLDGLTDRLLNTENYLSLGGVRGALEKHVEKVFTDLDAAAQQATKQIFLSLVKTRTQDGISTAVSKSMRRAELQGEAVQKTIDCLINENLLVSNSSESSQPALQSYEGMKPQQATIEVTHEILLTSWQRLKGWIREAGEILRIKDDLQKDMIQWNQTKRINEELLKPSVLAKILELQTANAFELQSLPLSTEEEKYIEASERFRKRELRRARTTVSVLCVLSFVSLGAGGIAWRQLLAAQAAQVEQYAANHRALLDSDVFQSTVNGLAAANGALDSKGAVDWQVQAWHLSSTTPCARPFSAFTPLPPPSKQARASCGGWSS